MTSFFAISRSSYKALGASTLSSSLTSEKWTDDDFTLVMLHRCSDLTSLLNRSPSEWAKITHPFHPLRSQSFPILRKKRISGVDTVVLWTSLGESIAIPLEWTDHADPSPFSPPAILDGECLVALTSLLESMKQETKKELDK
jgi:hypothetical protein